MPCPQVIRQSLQHCRGYSSFELVYEIPIELKHLERTFQHPLPFRETLRLPHQPTNPFPEYPVVVLNIGGFYITEIRITIYYPFLLADDFSVLPDLHKLPVIDTGAGIIIWQNIRIVVVSIGEHLYSILWRRLLSSSGYILHHPPASLLGLFPD